MTTEIKMGWAAPSIKDQFPQLPDAVANRLQYDSDSITQLSIRGILTPAEKRKAVDRFSRLVSDALKDERRAKIKEGQTMTRAILARMTQETKIQEVIERLRGTCQCLDEVADGVGIDPMDSKLCESIDQEIFKCTDCGWWCEMHEEVSAFAGIDEWTCRQCAIENHGWDGEG